MHDWCETILMTLDRRTVPVTVFFRDDDAGWEDARLFALLDCFERHRAPIDLAVIPAALTPPLARELLQRMSRPSAALGIHQHGFAHLNHETEGRKCEFGRSRDARAQRQSIEAGHALLTACFGTLADRIFTPPWNRCTDDTAEILHELGFRALSRDVGAAALQAAPIAELPVAVDWCKLRHPGSSATALAERIATALASYDPCGIMLHHGVMDAADLNILDTLLPLLRDHPMCRCVPMAKLLQAAEAYKQAGCTVQ